MGCPTLIDWNKRFETDDYEVELRLKMDELGLLYDALNKMKVTPRRAFKKGALLELFDICFRHYVG